VLIAALTLAGIAKVITFLVMLSILVVLHEGGHFLLARRNGVRVNEFAVGMGPKIFGWTSPRSGTLYSLRALPIGGYCAMQGEDGKTSEAQQQREFRESAGAGDDNFQAKSPWQRLAIVLAGPIANFLLVFAILFIGAISFGIPGSGNQPLIGMVVPNSPAALAGLHPGDRIISIDGAPVTSGKQMIDTIHGSYGKRLEILYERDRLRYDVFVTPAACATFNAAVGAPASPHRQGCIGFTPVAAYERVGLLDAVKDTGEEFVGIAEQTVGNIAMLVTHFSRYADQISGPIGIGQAAVTIQDFGWGPYFSLAAVISFALGLFNLLPVPALDGGRAAFIIAELIRGKPVDPEKEAMVHIAGFAALMALMVLVAFHDIVRIVDGKGLL
jgi:regulator of sigma E protease